VFVHPGVNIGDNVFVNSKSVLTQDVPAGAVVEGFPASRVTGMERVQRKMTQKRVDQAARQMLQRFGEIVLRRKLGLEANEGIENRLTFRYRQSGISGIVHLL